MAVWVMQTTTQIEKAPGQHPGFYLKCGIHWTGVTLGLQGLLINAHSADPQRATAFDNYEAAEAMRIRVDQRYHRGRITHEIVEVR